MICRLCLLTLGNEEFAVHLYDNEGNVIEAHLLQIISTYFPQIQVTKDDRISTKVCEECSEQLEDFHRFFLLIESKQKSLLVTQSQFLEVKDDVDIEVVHLPVAEQQQPQQTMKFYEEEAPYEIQNFVLADLNKYENVDNVEEHEEVPEHSPQLRTHCQNGYAEDNNAVRSLICNIYDDELPLSNVIAKYKLQQQLRKQNSLVKKTKQKPLKENGKKNLSAATTSHKLEIMKRNAETIAEFMQLNCDLCKAAVANFSELRGHFEKHHERNAYVRCCGKMFHKPGSLVEHIEWHRNPDVFKCDLCHKRMRSRHSLQVHKEIKHTIKRVETIACPKCGKKFRGRKCLENHVQRHPEIDAKTFPCPHCNKSFATAQRLRCHVAAIHDNIYPHVCDTCGKKFKFKPSFEKHILLHQGIVEPPQQCQLCHAWLKNKNALRLHRFRHEQDNCQCKYCGRICVTRTALRGHIRYTHRMQTNHQCTYCDKKFKVVKNLQEHLAVHTGTQLYSCPHCSRQCRSKSNMYVHIKRAHFNEWMQSKMARSNDPSHSNVHGEKIRELETS